MSRWLHQVFNPPLSWIEYVIFMATVFCAFMAGIVVGANS